MTYKHDSALELAAQLEAAGIALLRAAHGIQTLVDLDENGNDLKYDPETYGKLILKEFNDNPIVAAAINEIRQTDIRKK